MVQYLKHTLVARRRRVGTLSCVLSLLRTVEGVVGVHTLRVLLYQIYHDAFLDPKLSNKKLQKINPLLNSSKLHFFPPVFYCSLFSKEEKKGTPSKNTTKLFVRRRIDTTTTTTTTTNERERERERDFFVMLRPSASRQDSRKKSFKKSADAEESRRKREDQMIAIRKEKREEAMAKKRINVGGGGGDQHTQQIHPNVFDTSDSTAMTHEQRTHAKVPTRLSFVGARKKGRSGDLFFF